MINKQDAEEYLAKRDRLTIGQMADLCCLSKRALRFYDEKGLVPPQHLDKETGYRFYSLDQVPVIDRVARLQSLGFSLSEIAALLQANCATESVALFEKRLEETEAELKNLTIARDLLKRTLREQCSPEPIFQLDKPLLEWVPERKVIYFDIADLGIRLKENDQNRPGISLWYYALMEFKRHMLERGFPEIAFNEVSTVIPRESLENRDYHISLAAITLDECLAGDFRDYTTIPAGYCLRYYSTSFFTADGANSEYRGVEALLEHAESQGLSLRGDYMGLGNIDLPMHLSQNRHDFLCFQLPVQID